MTKGRHFTPSTEKQGVWFSHRGADNADAGRTRETMTSTGQMLSSRFTQPQDSTLAIPAPPPTLFGQKVQSSYRTLNPFSTFDNRNTIWAGENLVEDSRNMARPLHPVQNRLHHTERDFLKHNSLQPVDHDYSTLYATTYAGRPTATPPTHRRFSKRYQEPKSGPIALDTTTTNWFKPPDVPYRTPLRVLACSQEPFLKRNRWNYAYRPVCKVYPPYDRNQLPVVDNMFNRYGAAFTTGGARTGIHDQ